MDDIVFLAMLSITVTIYVISDCIDRYRNDKLKFIKPKGYKYGFMLNSYRGIVKADMNEIRKMLQDRRKQ